MNGKFKSFKGICAFVHPSLSSMEIEGEDGSKVYVNETGSKTEFGRGLGFHSDDRSVSRRHISFELCIFDYDQVNPDTKQLPRVSFEVLGRNPIWVCRGSEKDIRVFRNSEKGEMNVGDCFFVSAMNTILFTLKRIGVDEGGEVNEVRVLKESEGLNRTSLEDEDMMEIVPSSDGELTGDENLGFGSLDASEIDPVKEFGFVVMGHEFDYYPKHMIRDIKNLDWCIEEPKAVSEDDETTMRNRSKRKKGVRGKKDNIENEDDDWTGESEDEKVLISKLGKDKRPRYTKTRSKDSNKPVKDTSSTSKTSANMKTICTNDDDDEDNLGGFIVDEEEEKYDEDEDEDEEEEDYEEDEDDDLNDEAEI